MANVIADLIAVSSIFVGWGLSSIIDVKSYLAMIAVGYVIFRFCEKKKCL